MLTLKDFRIWSLTTDQDSSRVWVVSVDARTGKETSRTPVGWLPFDEPMQLTGMITPDGGDVASHCYPHAAYCPAVARRS
ncbi:MAG: hypothetical protein U1U88_002091 [Lawsonella clevelandensis]